MARYCSFRAVGHVRARDYHRTEIFWLAVPVNVNQSRKWAATFQRRFVSGFLFILPFPPELHSWSETKIAPDLRLNRLFFISDLNTLYVDGFTWFWAFELSEDEQRELSVFWHRFNLIFYLVKNCLMPVGVEDGRIPEEAYSASSYYSASYLPNRGRLNLLPNGGKYCWAAKQNNANQWLQVRNWVYKPFITLSLTIY